MTDVAGPRSIAEDAVLAAFAGASVGVAVLDTEVRFVVVNDALAALNGHPAADHVGRRARDLLPDIDPEVWDAIAGVIASGEPTTFLVRGRTPASEEEGAWQEEFRPWRDPSTGRILGVLVTTIDVSEQHRIQLTANRQQALLTGLAHLSAELVGAPGEAEAADLLCRHGATILGADAALVAVARRGEAVRVIAAHGFPDLSHDELVAIGARTAVADTARTGTPHAFVDGPAWEAAFPDGVAFHRRAGFAATVTVGLIAGDETVGALGVSFRAARTLDDEGRRALETIASVGGQALERARVAEERRREHVLRSAFLDIVAHELKTPLVTIYGGLETVALHGTSLGLAAREELLAGATIEARRLVRLVDDLVVLSRLERGLLPDLTEPLMLSHLSRSVVEAFSASTGIDVRLSVARPIPPVRGEAAYVEQVLRNLLSNASKYGRAPYEVVVTADQYEVAVRVLDAGDGLPPERDRLWDLYYRDPKAAPGRPGSGIGLFICRELIGLMGGRMWATDRAEGGAEFGFVLPVWNEE